MHDCQPGVYNRPGGKTECTEQQCPGKRLTPAPYDKCSESIQGQVQCLDHPFEKWEVDTLFKPGQNVTGHQ